MVGLQHRPDTKYIRRHNKINNLELTADAGGDLNALHSGDLKALSSSSSFFSKSFSFSSNFNFLSIAS